MIGRKSPSITQAGIGFFITAVMTLLSSAFFQPRFGLGTNLWINEFVYILFPALLLARINGWSVEDVYRLKSTSLRNRIISFFSGVSMWIFAFYLSKMTRLVLDNRFGSLVDLQQIRVSRYQSLLLALGMIILAPICEEIYFRGFIQKAYEGHIKRYGFVIAALVFGSYHILNGISEVIPATILGLGMGYLVYKTDSIATSMLFHAAANLSALSMSGALESSIGDAVPGRMHLLAFAGLCVSVVLMRSLKGESQDGSNEGEEVHGKIPVAGIVFLLLAATFLVYMGISEITIRLAAVK